MLLLRASAVGAGILIGLRALWGAWDLPPDAFWSSTLITLLGVLALALLAAGPVLLLVLARRAWRSMSSAAPPPSESSD